MCFRSVIFYFLFFYSLVFLFIQNSFSSTATTTDKNRSCCNFAPSPKCQLQQSRTFRSVHGFRTSNYSLLLNVLIKLSIDDLYSRCLFMIGHFIHKTTVPISDPVIVDVNIKRVNEPRYSQLASLVLLASFYLTASHGWTGRYALLPLPPIHILDTDCAAARARRCCEL